ncbi:SDR family NAD(P)-dependent oxidoreductase [Rhodovastum atsumiense]|uniref:SDR family oxidoreductase n=1 Tax=Rhodovastum atsumiense TaxID=504468 RepID=A0A5M6IR69_9PROT|nr:SDR family oxidoreductase [Rhodovastum atsumiense]KAA5610661.1 SDR family oxidoreductase [Rhodovastum atsumiense]
MTDPSSLAGRLAVVTGASRGIGRAIALQLAAAGAAVVVHYRRAEAEARAVIDAIGAQGGIALGFAADLQDRGAVRDFYPRLDAELQDRFGDTGFDILVNNAGIGGGRLRIGEVSEAAFDQVLDVNLRAPFFLIQGAIPRLRAHGRIINISSMGTRAAFPEMASYAPAKAGLEALTRLLAVELGPRGITVNAVLPGATATDMNAAARDPARSRVVAQGIALGRVGQPEDIAGVVAFLASGQGRWVTGQSIEASGGQRL